MPDHAKQRGEGQGLLREIPSGLTMDLEPRTFWAMTDDAASTASEFGRLFPAVYLRFHRRDDKRSELPNASRAVLQHLSARATRSAAMATYAVSIQSAAALDATV